MVQDKITTQTAARQIQEAMQAGVVDILSRNRLDQSFLDHPELDPNSR